MTYPSRISLSLPDRRIARMAGTMLLALLAGLAGPCPAEAGVGMLATLGLPAAGAVGPEDGGRDEDTQTREGAREAPVPRPSRVSGAAPLTTPTRMTLALHSPSPRPGSVSPVPGSWPLGSGISLRC